MEGDEVEEVIELIVGYLGWYRTCKPSTKLIVSVKSDFSSNDCVPLIGESEILSSLIGYLPPHKPKWTIIEIIDKAA